VSRIHAQDLVLGYGGEPVLSGVSFDLGAGVGAVVGPNGGGKSTLLRAFAGELRPGAGVLEAPPASMVLQTLDRPDAALEDFGSRWDPRACRLRGRLDVDAATLWRWESLSPGERRRWQLAAALYAEAGLLLLDEPTTHLDAEARGFLAEMLREAPGIVVLVSHDRALVDEVAATTLWVEGGRVDEYAGGYAFAEEARATARRHAAKAREEKKRELRRLKGEQTARRERAAAAEKNVSPRTRMKSIRDSDAREAGRKGRAADAAAALERATSAHGTKVARAEEELAATRVEGSLGGAFSLTSATGGRFALRAELAERRVEAGVILEATSVAIPRDARIHVAGPNGAGKSTLLRALADAYVGPPEELLYLAQDLDAEGRRAALDAVLARDPEAKGRVLTLVASLGVDPKALLRSALPSPGEARKLLLAEALDRGVRLLLLDEPESYLDAPSRAHLEDALTAHDGALVVVTHDARMAERITDVRWEIRDGKLTL